MLRTCILGSCLDYNWQVFKTILWLSLAALLLSSCSANFSYSIPDTATPFIITNTLPPISIHLPSETPAPSTLPPTAALIDGVTTTQVNVRGDPSTAGAPLGMLGPATHVQILGKDPSGNWIQIIYTPAAAGKGWLTIQYVTVKDPQSIPVIGAAAGPGSGPGGVIIQQVNVRSGPATDFKSLGVLNPKDVVVLTGKDASGVWLQIQFAGAPDGKGWVTAAFVQATGVETLAIVGQTGQVVGTSTPASAAPTITPTLVAAAQDNDSAQAPAVALSFSPSGASSLIYSSSVSTPTGDPEDWVQFTPYSPEAIASLTCLGNGVVNVELWQAGVQIQNWGGLTCGETRRLDLSAGRPYLLHLSAVPHGSDLVSIQYVITVETAQ